MRHSLGWPYRNLNWGQENFAFHRHRVWLSSHVGGRNEFVSLLSSNFPSIFNDDDIFELTFVRRLVSTAAASSSIGARIARIKEEGVAEVYNQKLYTAQVEEENIKNGLITTVYLSCGVLEVHGSPGTYSVS